MEQMFFCSYEARKSYPSPATKSGPSCSQLVLAPVAHALVRAASRLVSMLDSGLPSHLKHRDESRGRSMNPAPQYPPLHCLCRAESRRPVPLEIEATQVAGNIHHFPYEK